MRYIKKILLIYNKKMQSEKRNQLIINLTFFTVLIFLIYFQYIYMLG